MIKIKAHELFEIKDSLERLSDEQEKFTLNIGYHLLLMLKQLETIEEYVFGRLFLVVDETRFNGSCMTDEETEICNALFESEIEITPFTIKREDLFSSVNVELPMEDIRNIDRLFEEN